MTILDRLNSIRADIVFVPTNTAIRTVTSGSVRPRRFYFTKAQSTREMASTHAVEGYDSQIEGGMDGAPDDARRIARIRLSLGLSVNDGGGMRIFRMSEVFRITGRSDSD